MYFPEDAFRKPETAGRPNPCRRSISQQSGMIGSLRTSAYARRGSARVDGHRRSLQVTVMVGGTPRADNGSLTAPFSALDRHTDCVRGFTTTW
jgi:hypothetical protein